jgi:hypothetical protein
MGNASDAYLRIIQDDSDAGTEADREQQAVRSGNLRLSDEDRHALFTHCF